MSSIKLDSNVICVSWNNDSNRLLIGCESGSLQMWTYNPDELEDANHKLNSKRKNYRKIRIRVINLKL